MTNGITNTTKFMNLHNANNNKVLNVMPFVGIDGSLAQIIWKTPGYSKINVSLILNLRPNSRPMLEVHKFGIIGISVFLHLKIT